MKTLERILTTTFLITFVIYFLIVIPYWIYAILILGLLVFFLRFQNYKRINRDIDSNKTFMIPKRKDKAFNIIVPIAVICLIGIIFILSYTDTLTFRDIPSLDIFILAVFFPILNLTSSVKFSKFVDNYVITDSAIFSGIRYVDDLQWSNINDFKFDDNKSIIRLQKDGRDKLIMKVNKQFYFDNYEKIKTILSDRLNVA